MLKYLNKESTHTKATFKLIPDGVLDRLANITSIIEDNSKMSIKEQYPDHNNTLARVGLGMKIFPTLKKLWDNADKREKKKKT